MNKILVFGAGRSSIYLIEYLGKWCSANQYHLTVGDKDVDTIQQHLQYKEGIEFVALDIFDHSKVEAMVKISTLVVSLLPAALHIHIAALCLENNVHMATASYVSDEMKALHNEALNKELIFLNECGLDPGIDHMSAVQIMDGIRSKGGSITAFESYCGGLVANACDGDNPWKYKFSWNPRNVIVAGQGAPALYRENGKLRVLPYHRLFATVKPFTISGQGIFEAYPNRDSLKYSELYGLQQASTMLRGTFRKQGYAPAWQVLVQLGLTDDSIKLTFDNKATLSDWLACYVDSADKDLRTAVKEQTGCGNADLDKLEWLGFFGSQAMPLHEGTSAAILEELLKTRWKLEDNDRDLVVMLHKITYTLKGVMHHLTSSLVLEGDSNTHTAMAKTVGLPLAIACRLILENKIRVRGVVVPVLPEIYNPVLEELKDYGIRFEESEGLN